MRANALALLAVHAALAVACSSADSTPEEAAKAAAPRGPEIGTGDGSAASVVFTDIYKTAATALPVDLAFHPDNKGEVYLVGYGDNSIHIGTGVGEDFGTWRKLVDPAARHFMHKPPAVAAGLPQYFATCGDNDNSQTANGSDGYAELFMGPALFSTDPEILGKKTPDGLGSHMDMLHNTPLCRGIAHEKDNWFWVFNAYDQSLDRYNFAEDHGPGNDDHSDGEIYRYAAGQVKGAADGTPSHVFYDATDKFLYVADTGNARVVRLDTTKGTKGDELPRQNERLAGNAIMQGTAVEVVVEAGVLAKPSGIEVRGDLVYVSDAETSTFHVFDKSGTEVRKLETGLPPGSLAGFAFSPEGKVFFTDKLGGRVVRIDVPAAAAP